MEVRFSWSLSSSLRPSLAHLDHSHAWSAMTWLRPDTLPPRHHLCPFTPASHSAGVLSLRAPRTRYRMYLEYLDVLLCVAFRASLDIGIHTCMSLPCTGSSAPVSFHHWPMWCVTGSGAQGWRGCTEAVGHQAQELDD